MIKQLPIWMILLGVLALSVRAQQDKERVHEATWKDEEAREVYYPLEEGLASLAIKNERGQIEVEALDADDEEARPGVTVVRKAFSSEEHHFELKKQGDHVVLTSGQREEAQSAKPCKMDYKVTVPEGVQLRIEQGQGEVELEDLSGPLFVHLGQGKVKGEGLSGPIEVVVNQGEIDLEELSGDVSIQLKAGKVKLDYEDLGPGVRTVILDVAAGDVKLKLPEGANVASEMELSEETDVSGEWTSSQDAHDVLLKGRIGAGSLRIKR